MRRAVNSFLPSVGTAPSATTPALKPDLRVLTEDGTLLVIRWTPTGPQCNHRGFVSTETTRRIQALMRREWLLGVDQDVSAISNIGEEQRRHQRLQRRDTRYPRIGPPVGHWTDALGVLDAQWSANCRLCNESWERGDRIAWHREKGPFHLECAKKARDHRLQEPAASKFRKVDRPLPPWPPRGEAPHFTDRWRVVRARRSSKCAVCGALVAAHEPVLWSPTDELTRHYACGVFLREVDSLQAHKTSGADGDATDGSDADP